MLDGGWRWFTAQVVKQSRAKPVVGDWEEEEGEEGGKRASLALLLPGKEMKRRDHPLVIIHPPPA